MKYSVELNKLEIRCLQRALTRAHREDVKSNDDEAKRAANLEQLLIGKLELLTQESK